MTNPRRPVVKRTREVALRPRSAKERPVTLAGRIGKVTRRMRSSRERPRNLAMRIGTDTSRLGKAGERPRKSPQTWGAEIPRCRGESALLIFHVERHCDRGARLCNTRGGATLWTPSQKTTAPPGREQPGADEQQKIARVGCRAKARGAVESSCQLSRPRLFFFCSCLAPAPPRSSTPQPLCRYAG